HDFNDFEVGKRHNIKPINIFTPDAKIDISEIENPNDFIRSLAGKDRFEARELMVDKLRETGHLVKSEPCLHNVPHAERGGAVLEPRLTSQWYCDVKKLAEIAVEKARTSELKFIPDLWKNTWYSWLENVQPWCISRQLWWGHRIPAYYDEKGNLAYVGTTPPEGLVRDDDVLDTWFSSGLWPMATLGWPDVYAKDFRAYYPNSVIITGFDIIFFWVARMVMFGLYFTDKLPFDKVVLHGLVTDEKGLKMSKTKGNVIDPITIIDQYGIDAVRFAVCAAANQNRTNPFGHQNVEASHKFITKLMNAAEFWIRNGISAAPRFRPEDSTPLADWVLNRMNAAIANADRAMEDYRYDEYANNIYHFVWDDFCSSFIELAKREMTPATIAAAEVAMKGILRMLQPVVPFITAELWARMGFGDAVKFMREKFAEPVKLKCSPEEIETWWQTKQADKLALEDEAKNKAELTQVKGRIVSLERQLADTVFTSRAKSEIVAERRASLKSAYARRDVLEKLLKRSAD
ncbi:MAG: class I tRNA ligase family protein, partial [Rickettsiales bacterium]|nr:class I tRNA ligase family protein [Rickettsiales bacterium]